MNPCKSKGRVRFCEAFPEKSGSGSGEILKEICSQPRTQIISRSFEKIGILKLKMAPPVPYLSWTAEQGRPLRFHELLGSGDGNDHAFGQHLKKSNENSGGNFVLKMNLRPVHVQLNQSMFRLSGVVLDRSDSLFRLIWIWTKDPASPKNGNASAEDCRTGTKQWTG